MGIESMPLCCRGTTTDDRLPAAWCVTSLAHTPSQHGAPLSRCAGIPAARRLLEACLVDSGIDTSRLEEPGAMVVIGIVAAARGRVARMTVLFSTQLSLLQVSTRTSNVSFMA